MKNIKSMEKIEISKNPGISRSFMSAKELTLLTFNTGYACHDTASSFRAHIIKPMQRRQCSPDQIRHNLNRISDFLLQSDADIVLLQEVDRHSTRSGGIDQHNHFQSVLPQYSASFAWNYQVKWVPVPLQRPVGKVLAGLSTFFRQPVAEASRIQLPGLKYWPRRQFDLRRCLAEHRMTLDNKRSLFVFNLHLSAFDRGGQLRKLEMQEIKKIAEMLANDGHYVIFGGDWNHDLTTASKGDHWQQPVDRPTWLMPIRPSHKPEGYHWAYDGSIPTVRETHSPYEPNATFTAVIDGFLMSDNVQILDIKTHNLDFGPSDHHPVTCKVRLL
jgi:endonuclease/exonuclease/phosphatase family metal-dependent hydrolase